MQIRCLSAVGFAAACALAAGCFSADDFDPMEPADSCRTAAAPRSPAAAPPASVFLFRGLGEIFSPGLDRIAADLCAAGRQAVALPSGYAADAELPADGLLVLGGHSAGAFNAIRHARRVGRPVDLLVLIDPPVGNPIPVSGNVRRVLLLRGSGGEIRTAGPTTKVTVIELGSRIPVLGAIWNLTAGHLGVTADPRVHEAVMKSVLECPRWSPAFGRPRWSPAFGRPRWSPAFGRSGDGLKPGLQRTRR